METCNGCGMAAEDTVNPEKWELTNRCPECGAQKCSSCDMGDDVECISCENMFIDFDEDLDGDFDD